MLALASSLYAWNDCKFFKAKAFMQDHGVGHSYAYGVAGINGKTYLGGYTKGSLGIVTVTADADVNPNPAATIWGETTSDVQNLYIAEMDATGSMTKSWWFKGEGILEGNPGHGPQDAGVSSNMRPMLDNKHVVVSAYFQQKITLPDETVWTNLGENAGTDRYGRPSIKSKRFVIKLDTTSDAGWGPGTTGWIKKLDDDYPGGTSTGSTLDGDADGNMILTYNGCSIQKNATGMGEPTGGCSDYLEKLAAADGASVWKVALPKGMGCHVVTSGAIYCTTSIDDEETLEIAGTSVTNAKGADKAVLAKFNADGTLHWAKVTDASGTSLAVSIDESLLVLASSRMIQRIDLSSGNEGNVLWTDMSSMAVTAHGIRGVEVSEDGTEVLAFGQHTGDETITDNAGSSMTFRSRGSYEIYVLAIDAATGAGKYAIDGGGDGMEYVFGFSRDRSTGDIFISGTSRSENMHWGNLKRENVMFGGGDTSTAVGSSKAYAVKLGGHDDLPDCLDSCPAGGVLSAAEVKDGFCFIDRHCYANGEMANYVGSTCMYCDSTANPTGWSGPDTADHCHIGDKCIEKGAMKQVVTGQTSRGPRYGDSECEVCDPDSSADGYTLMDGYDIKDGGSCYKKIWSDFAKESNWIELPESCKSTEARRARQLKETKKRKKRKLSQKPAKASWAK